MGRVQKQYRWLVPLWCLVLGTVGADGATLSGRLTGSAYSWKTQEIDGTDARHVRVYQSVILNARRLGANPLSFYAYGQVSGELADRASGRHDYRIYHAYLQWRPQARMGLDLRGGRQRVYAGVGFGTFDGVRVQMAPHSLIELTGYAGVLVPLVPDEGIGTWDEGHLWGGQALLNWKRTALSVSFAERTREPLAYLGPGRFSGLVIQNDSKQFRRFGMDVRHETGPLEIYGRLDLDAEDWDLQETEVVGHWQVMPDLRVSAEFQHREPTLHLNSILSVFEVSNDREVGGRVFYRMNALISFSADFSHVIYDDDTSWRIGMGMLVGNGYIGYSRRLGYGGENDAFTASVQHPITLRLTLKADGSVAGYRLYETQSARDQAIAGSLGAIYRPGKSWSFDVEGQVLRNKFYSRDVRIFVRGSWWFFKRSGDK